MSWIFPCYCAETRREDFTRLSIKEVELITTVTPLKPYFFFVIFRKIKDCDLICLSAIFLSALIGEGKSSSRFQLFGEAANHVSRPVSVISLQSLRDEQHRWSCFFFPCENNLYLLPAHTRRGQQWRCCLVTFLSNKNQSCTERWE